LLKLCMPLPDQDWSGRFIALYASALFLSDALKRKSSSGLSGVIAALMVMVVVTAGVLATTYVSNTYSAQNRQMMEELRRQAAKDQELIRIYIHAENSSDINSPPRITIVNAWGFPTNITKLLAVYRPQPSQNRQVIEISRQIIVPPGTKVTLSPEQLGLSFTSFRQLADNMAALIAYTDAGNSFGSTWGYPREDNLVGATTVTTYNYTTTEVWQVPSFTTINNTFYVNRTITLNPPAPITYSTIRAVNHFEKINILARGLPAGGGIYYSASVTGLPEDGSPSAPLPDWRNAINVQWEVPPWGYNGWYYLLWAWQPAGGWADASDDTKTVYVERGTYYTNINAPRSLIVSINIAAINSLCTAVYSLRRVDVQPAPPNYPTPTATYMRQGEYVSMTHYPTTYTWPTAVRTDWDEWGRQYVTTLYGTRVYPAGPALTFNNYYRGTFTAALLYSGTRFVRPGDNPHHPVNMVVTTRTAPVTTAYGDRAWYAWQARISALPTYTVGPENPVYVNHFQVTENSYTIHRYYYVDKVECNIYTPSPPAPSGVYMGPTSSCGPGQSCTFNPPPTCDVTAVSVTVPVTGGGSSGGDGGGSSGGGGGSGVGFGVIVKYLVYCLPW